MSEMYPPPPPSGQNPQYPGAEMGQTPPLAGGTPAQPYQPQQPPFGAPMPSQPYYPQGMPAQGAAPSTPLYPQQPAAPVATGVYPSQPLYSQQPPVGQMGYPGGGAPVPPAYMRTNLGEYWKNAKNGKRNLSILAALMILLFLGGSLISALGNSGASAGADSSSTTSATSQSSDQSGAVTQATIPPAPTATPQPVESEAQYKASATSVTVADIAKDPNSYQGKSIHFTAVIANFVQDSNGNTAGANVDDPNDFSSVVQIAFTPSFSLTHVNKGDTIEVWGQGLGSFSGTNAFGATITEGGVQEVYLHDSTSGYSDNSITDPSSFVANSGN